MSGRGEPERIFAPTATANFFSVLGVEPVIGRTFQTGEDKPGAPKSNGADLRNVAAQVWWRSGDHRPVADAQWRQLHRRRRAAREFSVCTQTR